MDYSNYIYQSFRFQETGRRGAFGVEDLQDNNPDSNTNTIMDVVRNLSCGNVSVEQAIEQIRALGIEVKEYNNGSNTTITFEYNGKNYTIYAVREKSFEETIDEYDAGYIVDFLQASLDAHYNPSVEYEGLDRDLEVFLKELCDTKAGAQLKTLIGGRSIKDLVKALMKEVQVNDFTTIKDFIEGFRDLIAEIVTKYPNKIDKIYQKIEDDKIAEQQELEAEARARAEAEAAEQARLAEETRLAEVQSFYDGLEGMQFNSYEELVVFIDQSEYAADTVIQEVSVNGYYTSYNIYNSQDNINPAAVVVFDAARKAEDDRIAEQESIEEKKRAQEEAEAQKETNNTETRGVSEDTEVNSEEQRLAAMQAFYDSLEGMQFNSYEELVAYIDQSKYAVDTVIEPTFIAGCYNVYNSQDNINPAAVVVFDVARKAEDDRIAEQESIEEKKRAQEEAEAQKETNNTETRGVSEDTEVNSEEQRLAAMQAFYDSLEGMQFNSYEELVIYIDQSEYAADTVIEPTFIAGSYNVYNSQDNVIPAAVTIISTSRSEINTNTDFDGVIETNGYETSGIDETNSSCFVIDEWIIEDLKGQGYSDNDINFLIDYVKKYIEQQNSNGSDINDKINQFMSNIVNDSCYNFDNYFMVSMGIKYGNPPVGTTKFVFQMIKDFCSDKNFNANQIEYMLFNIINNISETVESNTDNKWSSIIKTCIDKLNELGNMDIKTDSEIYSDETVIYNYISGAILTVSVNDVIDVEAFFGSAESFSVDDIYNNLDKFLYNNDVGTRKFGEYVFNAIKNISNDSERKTMIAYIIGSLNSLCGYGPAGEVDNPYSLSVHTIYKLNHGQLFTHIDNIINDYSNYSLVYNENYQGDIYKVSRDDANNTITLINQNTGVTTVIDLNKMVENITDNTDRMNFLRSLESVPAEVLIDMWYESTYYMRSNKSLNGEYFAKTDNIAIDTIDYRTFTHETGHALDHTDDGFWSNSEPFASTFKKELNKYLADGHNQYGNGDGHYFTKNAQECFAEIYTYLMYGCTMHDTLYLTEYFSGCIELVKQRIEKVRNMSISQRRN